MKTILILLTIIGAQFIAAPNADAQTCSTQHTYVSGRTSCGCPIQTVRYIAYYDRCGYPIYRSRTQPDLLWVHQELSRPGVTLALDLSNRGTETVRLLYACDAIVREAGGTVYPAKDACMTPESFRAYFPQWEAFSAFIDPAFSSSFWRRVTA